MPAIDLNRYTRKKKEPSTERSSAGGLFDILNKDFSFRGTRYADKKKEFLYTELSSLLKAGIDFKKAFELVKAEIQEKTERILFEDIYREVINGSSFSGALEKTGWFSLYETFSLRIGEETGKQNEIMDDLASYYHHKIKQRRIIISSLTYPVIVLSTSLGAIFFMFKFVVPMFAEVYKRFGGELPWITQKIISLSVMIQKGFLPLVIIMIITFALISRYKKHPFYRSTVATLILRLPIVGNLVQKTYLARMCNAMRLLINAKLPLLKAIALSRQMVGYYPIEASLIQVEKDILQGLALHESLAKYNFFPGKMIQMLKVGEETNQLDYFFSWLADQYIIEVEHKTSTLSNIMQPFIIIFLGLIVGTILISMYLPLFQMSNNIQ